MNTLQELVSNLRQEITDLKAKNAALAAAVRDARNNPSTVTANAKWARVDVMTAQILDTPESEPSATVASRGGPTMTTAKQLAELVQAYGECSDTHHLLPMVQLADEILGAPAELEAVQRRALAMHESNKILLAELATALARIAELESLSAQKGGAKDGD